ncbi:MAG: hemin uptake protein HemP [Burkholderiales bacterium]|nr:MAG: hemin uptake protein HemP [Burkholderiales bacterium]
MRSIRIKVATVTLPLRSSHSTPIAVPPRTLDSQALLGPRGEVWIAHQGQLYRLRVTAQGKLILTK